MFGLFKAKAPKEPMATDAQLDFIDSLVDEIADSIIEFGELNGELEEAEDKADELFDQFDALPHPLTKAQASTTIDDLLKIKENVEAMLSEVE